ncbi:methyl-accepting chemotaxis protein [Acaryochloris sp. CCMEE 5410]|uniref:methyl-accepting chemotaxis protein n=1 Tax=Acaryochloris sp. CCMEE 5410 TaxID=310037 RepID=UPI0002484CAB|nr:methyl-accepting chemotaxis protein [Acaryochloris sp. CCMEE 5410]KAI9132764.1 type IV pili methyl-accepting chemotaxis transducer N-terminal domain-containing protein [Acaryochloris sp. CCMEE 5410]
MKITNQLRWTVAGLTAFAVGTTVYTVSNISRNTLDGSVVNKAGIVRGATQRLVKLETNGTQDNPLRQKIDGLINGLINGDPELDLPKATDPAFLEKIQAVETDWQALKGTIDQYRQNPSLKAKLVAESEDFFGLTNEAVFAAENAATNNVTGLSNTQFGVMALNLAILGFIFWTIQQASKVLTSSVGSVATSSYAIAETVGKQEKIISEQTQSVKDTTITIEGLGTASMQAAQQASLSAKGAQDALELSNTGTQSVTETVEGINKLRMKVGEIAEQIMQLSEQTGQISSVSQLVAGIADQTNMLALNAAVEAARAGEEGKGFAVVAGEIRKLADQSRSSADKINTLVADIQASINRTVMVTDEGTKTATKGIQLAEATNEVILKMAQSIQEVFESSQNIAQNSKKQAVVVQQAVSAINTINLGAQETASAVNDVHSSTEQLTDVAQQLAVSV